MIRIASLVMATGGLFGLWVYAAFFVDVPAVNIGDLSLTYNFAHIKIRGNVSELPSYNEDTGLLRITVNDGTGTLDVRAYSNIALELINSGRVPAPGDYVEVEGTLRIRSPTYKYLILNSAKQLHATRKPIENATISQIIPSWKDYLFKRLRVSVIFGEITRYANAWKVDAYDPLNATNYITMYFTFSYVGIAGGYDKLPMFEGGTIVTLEASVIEYDAAPELVPITFENANISLVPLYSINQINMTLVGTVARISGRVTSSVSSTITGASGVRFNVNDGTGTLEVICWDDRGLNSTNKIPAYNDNLTIVGLVGTYEGTLQFQAFGEACIILARDVVLLSNISDITSSDGRYISLTEKIASIITVGWDVYLNFSTGSTTIFAVITDEIQILTGPVSRLNLVAGDTVNVQGNVYYNGSAYLIYVSRTQNIQRVEVSA
ncbi:MAG: hypothetical protein QXS54_11175 [Candidatus Methanomethylicaceae archaeon]